MGTTNNMELILLLLIVAVIAAVIMRRLDPVGAILCIVGIVILWYLLAGGINPSPPPR